MRSQSPRSSRGYLASGLAAFVAGVGTYVVAGLTDPASDVSRTQFLTLDAKNELELEGITILFFMLVAGAASVLGCWLSLWLLRYPYAFLTALGVAFLLVGGSALLDELHNDVMYRLNVSKPYLFAALPFVSGVTARALVVAVFGKRAHRPPGRRMRGREDETWSLPTSSSDRR